VWQALASLADHVSIEYHLCDDSCPPDSYDLYEYIVPSPGIPGTHAIYQTGKVLSELDFAYRYLPKGFRICSVTGTDGKSTTSWILYNILEKEFSVKKSVYLSGNFDIPFSATVLEILKKWEKSWYIVLEVSSFMSYAIRDFQSDYAIFTNFRTDHLNWHRDLQEYLDAKMQLMYHTKKRVIMNDQVQQFAREMGLQYREDDIFRIFSIAGDHGDDTDGENIYIAKRRKYRLSETAFDGKHNALNILSCALVASELKICSKRVKEYLKDITWLPHRLERIGMKNGITFVEDSKSTSAQSLEAALGSFIPTDQEENHRKNLLIIVGWSDKGDNFSFLAPKFAERVRAMVCIGATKQHFIEIAKQEQIPYLATDSLSEWVHWLYEHGTTGDVLMLSPGCASFWLFRDYLDRANQFRICYTGL
jgi:UDP-N-acetylmuramoylalanine--D-glutamate ligase